MKTHFYFLFIVFLLLTQLTSYAQLSTNLTPDRLSFQEGLSQKAFLNYNGTHLTLENDETNGDITLDAKSDLFFQAGSTTRMKIDQVGKTMIGITTPIGGNLLTVNGSIALVNGSGGINFYEGTTEKAFLGYSGLHLSLRNNETGGNLILTAESDLFFLAGTTTRMKVDQAGNIMMGTTTPITLLTLNGDIALNDGNGRIGFYEGTNEKAFLGYSGLDLFLKNNETNGELILNGQDGIRLQNKATTELYVTDNKVGINNGTGTPTANLFVKQSAGEEGFAIENDGDSDTWSFEVGANDLFVYFNGNEVARIDDATGNWNPTGASSIKSRIKPIEDEVLGKLLKLRPTTFFYNHDREKKEPAIGLIAQEVNKIFPSIAKKSDEEGDVMAINYRGLTVLMLKAMQEQYSVVETKNKEVEVLQQEVSQLTAQLEKVNNLEAILAKAEDLEVRLQAITKMEEKLYQMENSLQSCCMNASTSKVENGIGLEIDKTDFDFPKLEQNQPNPFSTETAIQYYLPSNINRAQMVLTNISGQILKTFPLEGTGFGRVIVEANAMNAGNFNYSLVIDGKVIQSKKMVLTR